MNKFIRNVGFYLLIILVAISLIDYFSAKGPSKMEMNYSSFVQETNDGKVAKVVIVENIIKGTLSDGTEFTTVLPTYPSENSDIIKLLSDKNVDIKAEIRQNHHGGPPCCPLYCLSFSWWVYGSLSCSRARGAAARLCPLVRAVQK